MHSSGKWLEVPRTPPDGQPSGLGGSRATWAARDHLGDAAHRPWPVLRGLSSVATPTLLVIPSRTRSNPRFNFPGRCEARAARAVLRVPSFLPPMTRRTQKAQLFTQRGDKGLSAWEYGGFQLPAFSRQPLKRFAVCKQFYGDLLLSLSL